MKLFAVLLFVFFLFTAPVRAYPQDQLIECKLGAKTSPVVLGVPDESIEKWCDCVLRSIVDDGKEDLPSANECGRKYFK